MNGLFWVLAGGVAGWLTGKLIGERGYAETLRDYVCDGLDFVLGIVGASIGGHLFFWVVIGEGSSLSSIATAILGSVTLVGVVRLISEKYLPSGSR